MGLVDHGPDPNPDRQTCNNTRGLRLICMYGYQPLHTPDGSSIPIDSHMTLLGPQFRLGTNYLEFEWFVPKTGLRF